MILVTGSAGFIGSQITKYFDSEKIQYIGIDNFLHSSYKNVSNKKKFIKINYNNKFKVSKIIKDNNIKTVIHAGASSYVLEAENKKKQYFNNNIVSTKNFIDVCKKK